MKAEFDESVGLGLANKKEFYFYKENDYDVCDATTIAMIPNAVVTPAPIYHPYKKEYGVLIVFCLLTPTDYGLLLAMCPQLLKVAITDY